MLKCFAYISWVEFFGFWYYYGNSYQNKTVQVSCCSYNLIGPIWSNLFQHFCVRHLYRMFFCTAISISEATLLLCKNGKFRMKKNKLKFRRINKGRKKAKQSAAYFNIFLEITADRQPKTVTVTCSVYAKHNSFGFLIFNVSFLIRNQKC